MIKGSPVRIRVYRSTVAAAAAAAAIVSSNVGYASTAAATTLPFVTSAVGGDHSSVVTWTPKTPGTAYYDVEYLPQPFTGTIIHDYSVPANGTTETKTGLTNGVTYEVYVEETINTTVYTSQNGVYVTPNPPASAPAAPTGVTGAPGDSSVDLSWTAGNSNGSAITGYTIAYTDTTNAAGSGSYSPSGTPTTATVPSLVPGDSYTFTVTATNGVGVGTTSGASSSVTPYTFPGSPTGVSATGANASANVSWTAPSANGFTPITDYTVDYTDTSNAAGDGTFDTSATATSAVVTGLVNGDNYTFTVTATNADGDGPASGPSGSATPSTTPGAPTAVTAVTGTDLASANQVTVGWAAPASNGGQPVTGYTISYVDTTSVGHNGSVSSGSGSTSKVVTGLRAGDSYTFTVTATNLRGTGSASSPAGATPVNIPGTATGIGAVAGPAGSQATLHWTAPAAHGSAITGYTIEAIDTSDASGDSDQTATVGANATSGTVSGLVPGDIYTMRVIATNAIGDGVPSHASNIVTPFTTPDSPTSVSATGGDSSADVSWSAPANGGSAITSYVITYFDALNPGNNGSYTSSGSGTSATVPGLVGGETYTFTVTAVNAAGSGTASDPTASVGVVSAPDAPTAVTATAGPAGSEATISWTAPADTGGSAITGYTITLDDGVDSPITVNAGAGDSSAVADGLVPGADYTVTVVASNAIGDSPGTSAGDPVEAYTTPDAPTGVSATRGDTSVDLSWTAPADGGSPITDYTITYTDTSNFLGSGSFDTLGTATSATVPSLTNGDSYTLTVTAVNTAGSSSASDPSSAVTPATTPGVPTSVTAVADSSSIDLSWTAPADDGGSPITGYLVTCIDASASPSPSPSESESAGVVRPDIPDPVISGTSTTVTGLTPGDSYTCTVVAVNDVGSGSDSDPSNSVSPFTTADAPTAVTATADSGSADLSWTAPASDGGSPVTDYTITYTDSTTPGNSGVYNPVGTGTSATVPGLVPGDSYTFTVTAVSLAGDSPASDPSSSVVPYTTPGVPTTVAASAGQDEATVTWAAPASDGSATITGYVVTYTDLTNPDPGASGTDTVSGSSLSDTLSLTAEDDYSFTVAAINAGGTGTVSDPTATVTPYTTPGTPSGVLATATDSGADLSWTAPDDDGGSPITEYTITYTDATDPSGSGSFTSSGSGTSASVPGLVNGDSYTFTVTAVNVAGPGGASDASTTVTPASAPDSPTSVTATAGPAGSEATIAWTAPVDNGGSAITGYSITLNDGVDPVITVNAGGGDTGAVADGLVPGASYSVTIVATNAIGDSAPQGADDPVTAFTTPDAPTGVAGTRGDGSVDLSWTAPAIDGGSSITGYTITWTDTTNLLGSGSTTSAGAGTTDTITGLVNGDSYTFVVTATNAAGNGIPSAPSDAVTPATTPDAPTGVMATADASSADLSWTAPADNGSPITGYAIGYVDTDNAAGDGTFPSSGSGTSTTVTGLIPGDHYTFTVVATNDVGDGSASDPSSAVSPYTTPDAPTAVSATADSSSADLSWTAPASDGGSPITGYSITYTDSTNPANSGVYNPSGTGTTATVPSLVPGDAYTFTVVAINLAGNSTPSDPSTSVAPYTTPDAPTALTGARGNGSVDLSWTAPVNDGGSPVTDYVITYVDTDNLLGSGSFDTLGTATSATVPSLTNGDSYTFTVTAVNAAGSGTASDPSSAVTPATSPDVPTSVAATADSSSADVTWTAPYDGGSPVTGYTITYVDTDNALGDGSYSPSGTATSATVPLLIPGDHYTFTVTATNSVGDGSASGSSGAVQIFTTSAAPTGVTAAVGPHGAPVISFTAPVNTGFTPITGYTVVYADITHPAGLQVLTGVSGSPVTVTGLRVGDQYEFGVIANNAAGGSDFSNPSNTVTVFSAPGAPTAVTATAGTAVMTARWTAPTVTGGSPITGYTVTYTDRTNPAHTVVHHVGGRARSDQATVIPGESYSVSVTATNLYGTSAGSPGTAARTPYTLPSAPTGLTATAGNGTAALRWAAPASDGYSPVTGYRITVTDQTTGATRVALVGVRVGATVGGLTNGDSYRFTVAAVNAAGASAPSRASAAVEPIVALTLRSATLLPDVGVGLSATLAPFSVTLNRPGAISVALVEGTTVIDSTTVAAGGTTVSGNVRMNVTKVAQLGSYTWVIRDATTGGVLGRSGVTLKQNAFLAIVATRKGSSVDVLGVAKWASLSSNKVLPYAGKAIDIQRFTADGWVTVGTRTADAKGHINLTLTIAQRVGLRLVIAGTPVVIGVTSNVDTL